MTTEFYIVDVLRKEEQEMKRCIYVNIMLLSAILLCGCAEKKQEEKASEAPEWIMEEINRYNNEDMRQVDIKEDKSVSEGKLIKSETVVMDKKNSLASIIGTQEGPGDRQDEYSMYFGMEGSQAFELYKYKEQDQFYKENISEDLVNLYIDGRKLDVSDKAKIKDEGEDTLEGEKAVKIKITDPGFEKATDRADYKEMIEDAKAADADAYQEELDKYAKLKEKEWTLWFDKETHLLKKVSFDNSIEESFILYLLSAQDPDSDFAKQKPKEGTTVWNIKMGDECETIKLPEEYKEF